MGVTLKSSSEEKQMVLRIDGDYVQEETTSGMVMEQWFLHCLEVCEVKKHTTEADEEDGDRRAEVILEFNTSKSKSPSSRCRKEYLMAESDALRLQEIASPVLDALERHTLRLGALQCVKCQTEFTHDGYMGESG